MLSIEEIQRGLKLETIFMPEARKRRAKLYDQKENDQLNELASRRAKFVHYTSAESALSIIDNKCVWMRNTTCMADYREVEHGFDMLRAYFSNKKNEDAFCAVLDACVPGAAKEAIDLFNRWLETIRTNTYIASISEHKADEDLHGRLSMWRAFGGANTARIALVFSIPGYSGATEKLNIFFSPVAYLMQDDVNALLQSVMDNVTADAEFLKSVDRQIIIGSVFNMLMTGVSCVKHEGFEEEHEWRVIYNPFMRASPLIHSETKVIGGVPQIIHKLPLNLEELDFASIFERVIIGPSPYPIVIAQAFIEALGRAGVSDARDRVFASLIPIRS